MPEFVEYDPANGIKYEVDTYDGKEYMRKTQDVQGLLDLNAERRNTGACDGAVKNNPSRMFHICDVPAVTWLQLKKEGYDLFSKDDKMFWATIKKIESDYPNLKTTNKRIA